jgi:simple sugar transport system substrate-binding protein
MVNVEDDSLYVSWVGGNFVKEGEDSVEWLHNYLKEIGRDKEIINIVEMQGTLGSTAEIGRTEGIEKKIAEYPNFRLLEKQTGDFVQSMGQEVMEGFLKKYDDIDVLIAQNDNMAFGAIDAIEAAGLVPGKDIIIISIDAVKAALEEIVAGRINASIECNPLHGPRVAEIIRKLEAGEPVEKKIYVNEEIFDIKNAAERLPTREY